MTNEKQDALRACPMTDLSSTVGERVKFLRESSGMSLQDVANVVGSTKSHMSYIENGKTTNIGLDIIYGLSECFGVPVAALVETKQTARFRALTEAPKVDVEKNELIDTIQHIRTWAPNIESRHHVERVLKILEHYKTTHYDLVKKSEG